jgi:hypothetical protein
MPREMLAVAPKTAAALYLTDAGTLDRSPLAGHPLVKGLDVERIAAREVRALGRLTLVYLTTVSVSIAIDFTPPARTRSIVSTTVA